MNLTETRNYCATVRELVQFALDYRQELSPIAGQWAVRAIEYTTGKRSGYTGEDALVAIGRVTRDIEKRIPIQVPLRQAPKAPDWMDGGTN